LTIEGSLGHRLAGWTFVCFFSTLQCCSQQNNEDEKPQRSSGAHYFMQTSDRNAG